MTFSLSAARELTQRTAQNRQDLRAALAQREADEQARLEDRAAVLRRPADRDDDALWAHVRAVIRDAAASPDPWGAAADRILQRWDLAER